MRKLFTLVETNNDVPVEQPVTKNHTLPDPGISSFVEELGKQFPEVSFAKLSRIAARVAKWQKEQMLNQSVEAKADIDSFGSPVIDIRGWHGYALFDKVKVYVFKKD